ncbi:MAG: FHA domain-containing protein [Patulibacter minatonensis]
MTSATDRGPDPPWRRVPGAMTLPHLRRMAIREPHLIAEGDGELFAAAIPDRARWTVGREDGNDLIIAWDPSVSRLHATLERLGELIVVEDSGVSRNGTFVNGRRIVGRTRLQDQSEITLGHTTLLIRLPGLTPASAATVTVGGATRAPSSADLSPAELRVVDVLILSRTDPDAPIPTNREIGEQLGLGAETVKSHLKSIAKKLAAQGVRGPIDRSRLAELAAQGMLGQPDAL